MFVDSFSCDKHEKKHSQKRLTPPLSSALSSGAMRMDSPSAFSSSTVHTLDLSADELAFLASLIVAHIACLNLLTRSGAADSFDPVSMDRLHGEVRMGATLLGRFPISRKDST